MSRLHSLPRTPGNLTPEPEPALVRSQVVSLDHEPRVISVGRYALFREIASGGMATVHFGRLIGPAGFSRTVAIKRLHPQLAKDTEFVSMFVDEMRLAARIQHPNVVSTLDVVEERGELFLIMEYVHGESVAELIRQARLRDLYVPPTMASSIVSGLLHGLHSAHEARSENGDPLGIIHRDVSPQNALVGTDGVTRVLDFGIATAAVRLQAITRAGQLKGKTPYLAPERIQGYDADRRSDVYGAAIVLWEALTGVRLFDGENDSIVLARVMSSQVTPPSAFAPDVPPALDAITMRGLDRDPEKRFATAREMALALQDEVGLVAPSEIGDWVSTVAAEQLSSRAHYLAELDGLLRANPGVPAQRPSHPPKEPGARTTPSSTSISEEPVPALHRRTVRAAAGAVVVAAGLAVAAFGAFHKAAPAGDVRTPIDTPTPSSSVKEATPVDSMGSGMMPKPIVLDLDEWPTTTTPPAAASSPPKDPPPRSAEPTRPRAPSSVSNPPATPAQVSRDACRPPYTVDAKGVKHYKRDCMIDGRF